MQHRAGFVNIIGSPNVGKSTLMNALVGENLSIVTSKAQTTRHRIMGIVNGEDFQVVYSDTPGVLKPAYKLQEGMMSFVKSALEDADIILFVTDIFEKKFTEEKILARLRKTKIPILLLVNKIDLAKSVQEKESEILNYWKQVLPGSEILFVSALTGKNIKTLLEKILEKLPESPPYFPKESEELSDKPEKFFVSEIIREKILMNYHKEVPYSCEVLVESFREEENIIKIRAEIIAERDSQKGIIIGHKGEKLKTVGTQARIDMEKFLGKKVFLELFVKVDKDWRENEQKLRRYGYM